jgi:hypothetical protein
MSSYGEVAGVVATQESVRTYIEFVYDIDAELLTKLMLENAERVNHDNELQSFAYWTGDSIVETYNQPLVDRVMELRVQLNDVKANEDAELANAKQKAIEEVEAMMILSKERVDELDDVDEE